MMKNLALLHRKRLSVKNYVLKGDPKNRYWIGVNEACINRLVALHGEHFNLIVAGDADKPLDFFVIPYAALKLVLTDRAKYDDVLSGGRKRYRWHCTIQPETTTGPLQLVVCKCTTGTVQVQAGHKVALLAAMLDHEKCRRLIARGCVDILPELE